MIFVGLTPAFYIFLIILQDSLIPSQPGRFKEAPRGEYKVVHASLISGGEVGLTRFSLRWFFGGVWKSDIKELERYKRNEQSETVRQLVEVLFFFIIFWTLTKMYWKMIDHGTHLWFQCISLGSITFPLQSGWLLLRHQHFLRTRKRRWDIPSKSAEKSHRLLCRWSPSRTLRPFCSSCLSRWGRRIAWSVQICTQPLSWRTFNSFQRGEKTSSQKYSHQKRMLQHLSEDCEDDPKRSLLKEGGKPLRLLRSQWGGIFEPHSVPKEILYRSKSPGDVRGKRVCLRPRIQRLHEMVPEVEISETLSEWWHEGQGSLHKIQKRSNPCHPWMILSLFIFIHSFISIGK